jgi:hypothetical protein
MEQHFRALTFLILLLIQPLSFAAESDQEMRLFLMTGTSTDKTWSTIVGNEVDLSIKGKEGIEAMGGEFIGYYLGVGEASFYGIVAFPDSVDVSKIVYTRAMQGVVEELKFVEIMTTEKAAEIFRMINEKKVGGNI